MSVPAVSVPFPAPVRAGSFSAHERRSVVAMAGFVLLLHVVGWGVLVLAVAPAGYQLGSTGVLGVGVGLTAYMLGVRHAFDADHIASIDNTTRKLVEEGRPAVSTGFWFSLGHSSVVFLASLLLVVGVRSVAGVVQDESSSVAQTLGLVGTLVAGTFLLLIGVSNLGSAIGIARVFGRMRTGRFDEAELEHHLHNRGLLARLLRRVTRRVSRPWHLYPVGLLMGLGFDTATQVALLVLAAGSAAFVLPWYAILVLPVLFAAGMSLFDTADGVLMTRAYGWAFLKPVRKVFYNLVITVLSVAVALVIGSLVLVGLLVERLSIDAGPLAWAASLDLGFVGFAIVGLSLLAWGVAVAVWRLGRIEERWSGETAATEVA
ncbi:HoxN/HupN/NixA family nickel/cobalt transporter [Geodermatophilus sp. DSM 44513]|uniref:HoxN/HupN/NixA family nickel/cobalt transporter n=1 Tax=Geodermatophilus sp. DSM 44513 TaxID=1528104 RepID=UPI00127E82FF|nr:HoxN/HupN/NixA family nickel/cobalt transporter [Geodermatophilus sp. DSM 44513]WNV74482.1 HoxN/HupN/NixA family nickel/cobalt transporter [Geodermatophilus sp. DSM 44513]